MEEEKNERDRLDGVLRRRGVLLPVRSIFAEFTVF